MANPKLTGYKGKLLITDKGKELRLGQIADGIDPDDAINKSQFDAAIEQIEIETASTVTITKAVLDTLVTASTFEVGVVYNISDAVAPSPQYVTFMDSTKNFISSVDRYTGALVAWKKVVNKYTGLPLVDADIVAPYNVIYTKFGTSFYERVIPRDELNPDMWGAIPDYNFFTNTVVTDSTDAFQNCMTVAGAIRYNVRISPSYYPYAYGVSETIYIPVAISVYGDSPSHTTGSKVCALDTFTSDVDTDHTGVFANTGWRSDLFGAGQSWFWNSFDNIAIDARDMCGYGLAIYQFNENCTVRRTAIKNAAIGSYGFMGEHAPCTVENINTNTSPYGIILDNHPLDGQPIPGGGTFSISGNGGVIAFDGVSGDSHDEALVYIGGTHRGHIKGIKAESLVVGTHKSIVLIDTTQTGSGTPLLEISGAANRSDTSIVSNVVRIINTGRPVVNILNFNAPNTTNFILDEVKTVTIPIGPVVGTSSDKYAGVYHGDVWFTHDIVLTDLHKIQFYSGGTLRNGIWLNSGLETLYYAARNPGGKLMSNDGQNCLHWKDNEAGAAMLGAFGATPIVKPAVTGSRGGNAALESFLTQMAALGLITDSTTA